MIVVPSGVMIESCWHDDCGCPAGDASGLADGREDGTEARTLGKGPEPPVLAVSGAWSTRDTAWRLCASRFPPSDRRSSSQTPTYTPGPFPAQSKASVRSSRAQESDRAS